MTAAKISLEQRPNPENCAERSGARTADASRGLFEVLSSSICERSLPPCCVPRAVPTHCSHGAFPRRQDSHCLPHSLLAGNNPEQQTAHTSTTVLTPVLLCLCYIPDMLILWSQGWVPARTSEESPIVARQGGTIITRCFHTCFPLLSFSEGIIFKLEGYGHTLPS